MTHGNVRMRTLAQTKMTRVRSAEAPAILRLPVTREAPASQKGPAIRRVPVHREQHIVKKPLVIMRAHAAETLPDAEKPHQLTAATDLPDLHLKLA